MKNKSLKLTAMLVIPAALLAFTGCSSTPEPGATAANAANAIDTPEGLRGGVVLDAVTSTSTVQSINPAGRTVVLQHPDGSLTTYECGPEVRNFDQIKVGDQVNATVAESVAIILVKGGVSPSAGTAAAIVRAPLGAKPGGKIVDTVGFTARVVSVDAMKREVTLQTVEGRNQTVKVGPDINLANVKPGNDVGVRVTRAFAISVTPPAAAPAK
jgi:hypothetical protein